MNAKPVIVTDDTSTKVRVDNVFDADPTKAKPTEVIYGQNPFVSQGYNQVMSDAGAKAELVNARGVRFDCTVLEEMNRQNVKFKTAELLEAGDYRFMLTSRGGDAEGDLQTVMKKVKYLKVVPPGPKITKIQGDDEPTPAGEINEGRPFTITGERLAGATATWACVYEGTEHSGEVRANSSSETEMKCGGIVPVDGTIYFGDITITITTADGSATVTAKTGA